MYGFSRRGHRFPVAVIQHAVWLYYRFPLGFRDVEDMLAERGIDVSYEIVRRWSVKFGLSWPRGSEDHIRLPMCAGISMIGTVTINLGTDLVWYL